MTNLFKVNGQELTPIEIYPAVSDTVNYLTFAFMFSYDWAGLTKSAIFTKGTDVYEVVLTNDEVLESDHVNLTAGTWSISVVGDTVVDAVVTRQITTNSYEFTVTQSSATSGGVFPPSVASQVYINTNQETPQRFVGGIPKLAADREISDDNDLVDKKHVADVVATVTADDFNHNDLADKQGGTAGEYYHITQAQNAALHAHSNKTALDAVSGTNTGDQDVSGAISTHNNDAGAHTVLARKTETMRLLISRTIGAGENVSAITWTQDDAGNALALKEARIIINVPSNSLATGTFAQIWARINDVPSGYFDAYNAATLVERFVACFVRNLVSGSIVDLIMSPSLSCSTKTTASDGTTVTSSVFPLFSCNQSITGTITKIYFYLRNLTYFPTGTTIEIYGRTA